MVKGRYKDVALVSDRLCFSYCTVSYVLDGLVSESQRIETERGCVQSVGTLSRSGLTLPPCSFGVTVFVYLSFAILV
jgi:hypothetical protein